MAFDQQEISFWVGSGFLKAENPVDLSSEIGEPSKSSFFVEPKPLWFSKPKFRATVDNVAWLSISKFDPYIVKPTADWPLKGQSRWNDRIFSAVRPKLGSLFRGQLWMIRACFEANWQVDLNEKKSMIEKFNNLVLSKVAIFKIR